MGLDVAITGMGVVSALGQSPAEMYARLKKNDIAICEVPWTRGDPARFEWWAPVMDFDPSRWVDERVRAGTVRFAQHAIAATTMAVADAAL